MRVIPCFVVVLQALESAVKVVVPVEAHKSVVEAG